MYIPDHFRPTDEDVAKLLANLAAADLITATAASFDVTSLQLRDDGSFAVTTAAVPEPPTWALLLFGLLIACFFARMRSREFGRHVRFRWSCAAPSVLAAA